LLAEDDIEAIFDSLCAKCQKHCTNFVHLPSGRGGQHVMSDIEIEELIREDNRRDLLQLLTVEKGTIAKVILDLID
jgi:hypothetical protein